MASSVWRIGVFVDVQNLYHTSRELWPGHKTNYRALRDYILSQAPDPRRVTFHAFTAINPEWRAQEQFLWALVHMGYRILSKPIRKMPDGSIKGDTDLEMAMEILQMAPYLDEVVLVTGDGDFVPLVHHLARMGKVVRVLGPGRLTAQELAMAAHYFQSLDSIDGFLVPEDEPISVEASNPTEYEPD